MASFTEHRGRRDGSGGSALCVSEGEIRMDAWKNQENKTVHACAYEDNWDIYPSDEGLGCPMTTLQHCSSPSVIL